MLIILKTILLGGVVLSILCLFLGQNGGFILKDNVDALKSQSDSQSLDDNETGQEGYSGNESYFRIILSKKMNDNSSEESSIVGTTTTKTSGKDLKLDSRENVSSLNITQKSTTTSSADTEINRSNLNLITSTELVTESLHKNGMKQDGQNPNQNQVEEPATAPTTKPQSEPENSDGKYLPPPPLPSLILNDTRNQCC